MPIKTSRAGVAQLVEQRTCNAKVEGSTPFTGTNFPLFRLLGQTFLSDDSIRPLGLAFRSPPLWRQH